MSTRPLSARSKMKMETSRGRKWEEPTRTETSYHSCFRTSSDSLRTTSCSTSETSWGTAAWDCPWWRPRPGWGSPPRHWGLPGGPEWVVRAVTCHPLLLLLLLPPTTVTRLSCAAAPPSQRKVGQWWAVTRRHTESLAVLTGEKNRDKVEVAFNKFDLNHDGFLSWEEFMQVSNSPFDIYIELSMYYNV